MKTQKLCLECDYPLRGRRDKKFCSDACRSAYHNQLRGPAEKHIRNTNIILRKNRKILIELYHRLGQNIPRFEMLEAGFKFPYATSIEIVNSGQVVKYCYDVSYIQIKDQHYKISLVSGN